MLGLPLLFGDSNMLGWGCDKCVLRNKLMLHRLQSNILQEDRPQVRKKKVTLFLNSGCHFN
jgi:hypothetical protein